MGGQSSANNELRNSGAEVFISNHTPKNNLENSSLNIFPIIFPS
jgi:hypothetical protein